MAKTMSGRYSKKFRYEVFKRVIDGSLTAYDVYVVTFLA
jgi:hypothetical protein